MNNFNRYKNQVAIVTGGASGIGAAVAERLAAEGAMAVLFDINEPALAEQETKMGEMGLGVQMAVVDITNEQQVEQAVGDVVARNGRLDVLINSAGIVGPTATKVTDYALADFQKVVAVNLTGSFIMTKYCLPPMLAQGYGRILLIASIGGKEGNPGMAGYAASKSGVMGLVKGTGKEYADTGITVNGLAPSRDCHPYEHGYCPGHVSVYGF